MDKYKKVTTGYSVEITVKRKFDSIKYDYRNQVDSVYSDEGDIVSVTLHSTTYEGIQKSVNSFLETVRENTINADVVNNES